MDNSSLALCTLYYSVWLAYGYADTYEEYYQMRQYLEAMDIQMPSLIGNEAFGALLAICED